MFFKQRAALAVSLRFHAVVFDRLQKTQLRIEGSQRPFESSSLLRMLRDRRVKQGNRDIAFLAPNKPPHQIGCNRSAGESVDGYNAQAPAIWGISDRTYNGNTGSRGSTYPRSKCFWMAGEGNDPVHFLTNGGLKNLFLPVSKMTVSAKINLDVFERHRRGLFTNAGPHLIPKRCGAL